MDYEAVIGLEVHVQLSTSSKIFSRSRASFGADPNTHIDPVTFGLPGALPVLNRKVVESAILLGLATHCEIRQKNTFARKHYFYPDLPKGYQISQFSEPICEKGNISVHVNESVRSIGITRIHMEEDAGKSIHDPSSRSSLVDLNRAGVPLLEVVSEPDLRSPAEAGAYVKALRQIVRYLGISDGNMEEGSLRCDANISLRPRGELKFGIRTEIKNINSFRFVERALEYEIARHAAILKQGNPVIQETRLFDSDEGVTKSMRSKEESADYRYFPDPDLPQIQIEQSWITSVRTSMPKLPEKYRAELVDELGLSEYDADVLLSEKAYVEYFFDTYNTSQDAKSSCSWITSELFGSLKKKDIDFAQCPITAKNLGTLIRLIGDETISGKMGKQVFEEMFESGKSPESIVEAKGLKQISDDSEILKFVQSVFDENPQQLAEYLDGKTKVHGFFVGKVMQLSKGSANPKKVNDLIKEELERRRTDTEQ